jgi:hypothetical protein
VGPCHHSMARPQVADGGTASSMEGSCEYIGKAVADSRKGVVLRDGDWARCWQLLTVKTYLVTKHSYRKSRIWADTLDRDRWRPLVNAIMNRRVPYNAGNLTSWKPVGFSRRTLLHGVSKWSPTHPSRFIPEETIPEPKEIWMDFRFTRGFLGMHRRYKLTSALIRPGILMCYLNSCLRIVDLTLRGP